MNKLLIEGMMFHAFHGCKPEEAKTGRKYRVDVTIDTDFSKPANTDNIEDALDYVTVYELTRKEMNIRSHLIEHVARRIHKAIREKFPETGTIDVKVYKLNPPVGGEVESVCAFISK